MGLGYLDEVGEYGHLKSVSNDGFILSIKDGVKTTRDTLIEIAAIYSSADQDFLALLEA